MQAFLRASFLRGRRVFKVIKTKENKLGRKQLSCNWLFPDPRQRQTESAGKLQWRPCAPVGAKRNKSSNSATSAAWERLKKLFIKSVECRSCGIFWRRGEGREKGVNTASEPIMQTLCFRSMKRLAELLPFSWMLVHYTVTHLCTLVETLWG